MWKRCCWRAGMANHYLGSLVGYSEAQAAEEGGLALRLLHREGAMRRLQDTIAFVSQQIKTLRRSPSHAS